MHTGARLAFGVSVVLAATALTIAAFVALTPKPVPIADARRVAIASLATLKERQPAYVVAPGLQHLKAEARRERALGGPYSPMGQPSEMKGDLSVYLIRYDGTVRAFIASDPRNGCRLNVDHPGIRLADGMLAFHDVCHGSLYDVNGEKLGGPTPWALDELVVTVRDGTVYVDRSTLILGRRVRNY